MFSKHLLFAVLLLMLGCAEQAPPAKPTTKAPEIPSQKIGVPFVQEEVYVPAGYVFTSKEEIKALISKDTAFAAFTAIATPLIWNFENPFASALFKHPAHSGKMVFLAEWDKVPLTKEMAKIYVNESKKDRITAWKEFGCAYKILEGNYIETNDKTIIKSSFKLTFRGTTFYSAEYVITNRNQTFFYFVIDTEENDLESLVRKI